MRTSAADTIGWVTMLSTLAGDSQQIDIDGTFGTSFEWHPGTALGVWVEDLSGADGRPDGVGETIEVQLEVLSGTGQIDLEGLNVCES